jgi:hypothetical protein
LQRQLLKRKNNCGPSASALVYSLLQLPTYHHMDALTLKLKDLETALAIFGPEAPAKAPQVRRVLLGRKGVEEQALNNLLQGVCDAARVEGDYAEIIEATGAEVTASTAVTLAAIAVTVAAAAATVPHSPPLPSPSVTAVTAAATTVTLPQVYNRAVELARTRYYNKMNKKRNGDKTYKIPRFDPVKARVPEFPDKDDDGNKLM